MALACQTVTVSTPAAIVATNMVVSPLNCVAPCNITVDVTWTNNGGTAGSLVPNITIDAIAVTPAPFPAEQLAAGASVTRSFSVTNLAAGPHPICPLPN